MTVEIPLTQGFVAIVDDQDAALILGMRPWFARPRRHTVYAYRQMRQRSGYGGQRSVGMHNVITGWSYVDHVNGDGLDNRRANLRPATESQNQQNRRRPITNTSGYKGVHWHAQAKRWRARIEVDGRRVSLGLFVDPAEAARAYDAAATDHFGEFARLNFPGTIR